MKVGFLVGSHALNIVLAILAGRSMGRGEEAQKKLAATKSEHRRTERKPDPSGLIEEIVLAEQKA